RVATSSVNCGFRRLVVRKRLPDEVRALLDAPKVATGGHGCAVGAFPGPRAAASEPPPRAMRRDCVRFSPSPRLARTGVTSGGGPATRHRLKAFYGVSGCVPQSGDCEPPVCVTCVRLVPSRLTV